MEKGGLSSRVGSELSFSTTYVFSSFVSKQRRLLSLQRSTNCQQASEDGKEEHTCVRGEEGREGEREKVTRPISKGGGEEEHNLDCAT